MKLTLKDVENEIGKCLIDARAKFLRVAELIVMVRDEELYLEVFPSFDTWCEQGMGWTKRRANQLIAGAEVVNDLPPSLAKEIQTESEARALGALSRTHQKQAIREAKREGVSITSKAKSFSENAGTIAPKPGTVVPDAKEKQLNKPPEVRDETGYPIPAKLHEFWNRRQEMQKLMTAVSQIKVVIEKARAEDDVFFRPVNQAAIDQLERTYSFLSDAKPYAVCLNCQGHANDACRACKGTGLISKFGYEVRGDKQARAMREAVLAKGKT